MKRLRVALVQVASPNSETMEERRSRVAKLIRSSVGADLIVLPELWGAGYFAFDRYADEAETLTGRTVQDAATLAHELNAYIHIGSMVEKVAGGKYRNTAALLDRSGTVIQSYSKVHVFGYESQEAHLLQPGEHLDVVDTEFGPVASTTCYDLRFPELWRRIVDLGAHTVVVPAAWPVARLEHWRLFTSARAVEEQILVIACNAVGKQGDVTLGGHSRIVDPWGTVLVEAGTDEGVTMCDVDPDIVADVRARFPVLGDRLPSYAHLGTTEGEAANG